MSPVEFQAWIAFYRLWPFDDFHRFHRPAALIASTMGNGEVQPRLDWLQPPPATTAAAPGLSEADRNTMKAFGFTPPARG
jgi:hypothetical protein